MAHEHDITFGPFRRGEERLRAWRPRRPGPSGAEPRLPRDHLPGYFKNSWILLANPQSRNFHPVFSFFAHREIGKPRAEAPSLEDGKRFATSIRSFLRRNLEMTRLL
jgi:hypothetical protein